MSLNLKAFFVSMLLHFKSITFSGADGEIILGRPYHGGERERDHLAGFVSLDFDGFTSGDRDADKKAKKAAQEKEKLAIIVGGKSQTKPRDESDLVNFLNNDKEHTETFVFSSDKNPPQGFAKIDLPFMDPTKHQGNLPKAFIAPKGIPIPDGYKGKPLPQVTTEKAAAADPADTNLNLFRPRPSVVSRQPDPATKVRTSAASAATDRPKKLFPSSSLRFKTKNRPSLTDFIRKNKKKVALLDERNESGRERVSENNDKVYRKNTKIQEARKEFQELYKPTENTASSVVIPVENNINTFKLVTEHHEHANDIVEDSHNNIIDVISAGEDDNDPISLVFEPEEVVIQSTLEQVEKAEDEEAEDDETAAAETSTSFAPTVIPTTVSETTAGSSVDTTTFEQSSSTSTTTTSTTTTTVSTTAAESTERGYKFTTQDPFARLESLKKKFKFGKDKTKSPSYQGDLLTAEDIDDTDAVQPPATESPVFNFASPFRPLRPLGRPIRKFGNGGDDKEGFGRRIKKKRPGVWVKKYTRDRLGGIEPTRRPYKVRPRLASYTTTTTETAAAAAEGEAEYKQKQKYRPFFEDLYSQLTESPDTEADTEDSSRRYGLPRRRSTTPPSAFTEVVEIYEVHPKTRLRITTRAPTTRTQEAASALTTSQEVEGEEGDYNYQDDYVYQPTTSASAKEEQDTTTASSPPLEYQEYVPTVKTVKTATEITAATEEATTAEADEATEAADVHETADKHPTTTLASVAETTFSYEAVEEEVDRVELDIQNEIGDQVVEESQQVETTWNEVIRPEEEHTLASSRLTEYQKDVDTSHYGE